MIHALLLLASLTAPRAEACSVYLPGAKTPAYRTTEKAAPRPPKADIDTLIFDVGGVLSHNLVGAARDYFIEKYPDLGLTREKLQRDRALADQGLQSDADYQKEALRAAGVPEKRLAEENWKAWGKTLARLLREKNLCDEDVVKLARSLAGSGKYKTGVVSNDSVEMGRARMDICGYERFMGRPNIFVSGLVAPKTGAPADYLKPKPALYKRALVGLGRDKTPAKAVFIDDREKNVLPAAALGMHAIMFGGEDPDADGKYESVENLKACLDFLGVREP